MDGLPAAARRPAGKPSRPARGAHAAGDAVGCPSGDFDGDVAPGLYIHVPFCASVCPYCDFAVQTGGPAKRRAYVEAVVREIEGWAEKAWFAARAAPEERPAGRADGRLPSPQRAAAATQGSGRPLAAPFDTIFVGGGTPSSLDPEALARVFEAVRHHLPVTADAEISLEANPEDVTPDRLAAWKRLGVSRLSIGVQSFFAPGLAVLGRAHTAGRGSVAVRQALESGFESVSLDLIFAVPDGAAEAWELTLDHAVDLQPDHISCYELTVHEGTRLFRDRQRGRFVEMRDDAKAEQFFFTHAFLADAGYTGYEVSNFARSPGHRSRHNRKYWRHVPYLGVGPSAHSFDGTRRWWNERRLADWMGALRRAGHAVAERETLAPEQLTLEALALGLRTRDGVDLERITRRWGIELRASNADLIDRLAADGLLRDGDTSVLAPTLRGMAVADSLAAAFAIPARPTPPAVADDGALRGPHGAWSP